jgi:energy-coupling factor transporter ATP-binding protein EcfA2
MVKLKRLKIEKFRNVKPGTELLFRDSLNVLLGRNGTGKTTLLNLIVQLLSWDFSSMLGEAFALEYELESPDAELKVRVRNEVRSEPSWGGTRPPRLIALDTLFRGSQVERYEASGEIEVSLPRRGKFLLSFAGSKLWMDWRDGTPPVGIEHTAPLVGAETLFNLATAIGGQYYGSGDIVGASVDPWLVALGPMAGALKIRRFDESLGFLESITNSTNSFSTRVVGEKRYVTVALQGGPQVIARRLNQMLEAAPESDEVRIDAEEHDASFLLRVVELLEFKSAQVRLQRTERISSPREEFVFGGIRFDFTRRDDSVINHALLSYGQKRLLAFYYYLASNPDCVVADELVNGMHHEWIEACLEELAQRQAFLTSQNPLLLDYLSFESAEEVRSSFVLCRTELQEGREQMVWENMTASDAEGFFNAYQVAIQHVSELLRTRGLW